MSLIETIRWGVGEVSAEAYTDLHYFSPYDRFSQSKEAKFTLNNLNVSGAIGSDH